MRTHNTHPLHIIAVAIAPLLAAALAAAEPFPGPGGYIAALKTPALATRLGEEPEGVRPEDEKWRLVHIGGKALGVAFFYTGGIVARDLAVLTPDRLVIASLGVGEAKIIWSAHNFQGARPLGLAVFDTNGDGREEIFVNAMKEGGLASAVFDKIGGEYRMIASGLPYFFSATPGGRLLAQKLAKGGHSVDPAVLYVSREEGDLRLDPAFTIEGEAPLGLYGADADGDGVMEMAGVPRDGALALYSPAGKLLWKAGGLGAGAKISTAEGALAQDPTSLRVPARVVRIKDQEGWPVLAVGSSAPDGGVFLGLGQRDAGAVRLIRAGASAYTIKKKYVVPKAWIGGLIDLSGGPLGKDSLPGFVAVQEREGTSTIYLPPDFTELGPELEITVSFGGPDKPRRDRTGR